VTEALHKAWNTRNTGKGKGLKNSKGGGHCYNESGRGYWTKEGARGHQLRHSAGREEAGGRIKAGKLFSKWENSNH